MPLISVITPMGRELPELWTKTAASIEHAADTLPAGWSLQWCIHADGVDPGLVRDQPWWSLLQDRISLSASARSGFAGARNKALAHADGEVLGMCDDDDELAVGWARLLPTLLETGCGWVAGAAEDIDPAGTVLASPPLAPGRFAPGMVNDVFLATGVWPWHGCAAVVNAGLLRTAGGWTDLPWCEDLSMWAAITEQADGVQLAEVVYRWRQHPDRSTFSPTRAEHLERSLAAVRERIATLRTNPA